MSSGDRREENPSHLTAHERLLTFRLGLRLLRPRGTAEAISAVWVVAATAVLLLSVFVIMGFLGSLDDRRSVLARRTPIETGIHESAGRTPLGLEQENDIGGRNLIRLVLSPSTGGLSPPAGFPRWPGPGEVLASPAAVELVQGNVYAAALAPGRVVGTIGPQALRDPDEAYVAIGMTRTQVRELQRTSGTGFAVAGFGGKETLLGDVTTGQLFNTAVFSFVILIGGGCVLLTSVTRRASRARRRRISVLQLMGASTAMIRSLAAIMTGCTAGVGAVIACLTAGPLGSVLARTGVSGVRWWPDPTWSRGTPPCVVSVLVAWTARRTVDRDPWSQRRDVAERRPSGLRAIPVFLGTCSLAGVLFTEHRNAAHAAGLSNSGSWILLAGLLAIILGAPSAAPTITRAVAYPLLHLPGLSWHLAAARARHHAVSTARISGAVMIITVTSGVTIGVWDIAHSRYDHSTRGSLELSLASSTQTSWVREQAVELLTRDDLISATVTHDWEKNPQEPFELLTRKGQIRGDDLGYSFVFPSSVARTVAAQVEKSHPGEQTAMFDHELSGPNAVIQESAAVLLAQFFSVLIVFLSLVTGLISLQQDRAVPDMALLISGLSRNRLRLARTHEILLTVLPSTLLATAVAWFAAQAVAHVDDPTIDVHTGPLIALSLGVVGLGLLLAGVAAATTPALNPAVLRRD